MTGIRTKSLVLAACISMFVGAAHTASASQPSTISGPAEEVITVASADINTPDIARPVLGEVVMRTKRIWKKSWILGLTVLVMHILGFVSSIHAVMSTRTSQGAIAWIISLNTFPYVAVPAYWILGRSKFNGYVTASHADDEKLPQILRDLPSNIDRFSSIPRAGVKPAGPSP